jgi:hypothetical protein
VVEQQVRQRAAVQRGPDGLVPDVDRPRVPSPAVDRRSAERRQELEGFLQQVQTLRAQAQGGAPDFGSLRERIRALTEALRRHSDAEAERVLESINMDLGAGD